MPIFNNNGKGWMLSLPINELSLHSAYDIAGAHEISGGTPPYARVPVTMTSAGGGNNLVAPTVQLNVAPPVFNVPAGATVAFIGMWYSSPPFFDTNLGMTPVGGDWLRLFTVDAGRSDLFCPNHGLLVGDSVVLWGSEPSPAPPVSVVPTGPVVPGLPTTISSLPTTLTEGTIYYVVVSTATSIRLAITPTGGAIAADIPGGGFVQRCSPATFTIQTLFTLPNVILDGNLGG